MPYTYYLYSGSTPRMFPMFLKPPILFRTPSASARDEHALLEFWGLKSRNQEKFWGWQFTSFKANLANPPSNEVYPFRQMTVTEILEEPILFNANCADGLMAELGYAQLLDHLV